MNSIVDKISFDMSLRTPQKEALQYLDDISCKCDYKIDNKQTIEKIASENCENKRTVKGSDQFDFPSFCFAMTTGIGKTRLMGASIYYLYKTKGYRHFFILAPGNTIYEKLRKESNPGHPKYIFKGLEAEMGRPRVYDGENYTSYKIELNQYSLELEHTSEIQLFIFNIGKIFNSKTDTQFKFHKFKETLGASFADVLAGFDDLVICMDEAHRYYAPESMKAINYLQPILGLEFTATPKTTSNIIYSYDLARGAAEGYLKTPVVLGRSNTHGYSQEDIEEMKVRDGLTLHEHRKTVLQEYCSANDLPYVKPIVLIACKDTNHAKKIRNMIDNDSFINGKYKGRVVEIHSNMRGEETDENIAKLLSIEKTDNPYEIVLHVYKLKEGWDVNNLFTIIPLNAAKSDILAMQTIGRGLRLPFGFTTGNEDLDTLDIVAHDHYRELVDEIKNNDYFKYRDLDEEKVDNTETIEISGGVDDNSLSTFEQLFNDVGITSFDQVENEQTQTQLYKSYLETFGNIGSKKKQDDSDQLTLFDLSDIGNEVEIRDISEKKKANIPLSKDEFKKTLKEYSRKAISVPKILIQTNSTIHFKSFDVKRTVSDFEVASSKIERFDAINQQLLTSLDAQALEVDDALNTLACMLLDNTSELSYEDADLILDLVSQYLNQLDGDDENKRKIVRRYAPLIINDIKTQMYQHVDKETSETYLVQKDIIVFKKIVKSVKQDGKVAFNRPFNDKVNIKKYLFTGYKKSYYPENGFDSDTERLFSIILEEDKDVVRWIKPPLNQLGLFWQAGQQYNPDFLVETKNNKYMVEVKAANEAKDADVIAKAKEGIKWCKYASEHDKDGKPWSYRLIVDTYISPGNSCKYTLGTAMKIQED